MATPPQVIVIGAGPCGLMLAIELGRRGINTLVLNERLDTSIHPKANATQARTMEHFRRLGFVDKVRAAGLPPDYPTDIAYFTRFTGHELARLELPSSASARDIIKTLKGSWSAAELPHRCSQMFIESVLREEAEKLPSVDIRWGMSVEDFAQDDAGVQVSARHVETGEALDARAPWLVAADGASSPVRRALGIRHEGEAGRKRHFFGGQMHAMHIRSDKVYDLIEHKKAWMYVAVNLERRGFMATLNGTDEFVFHVQLHDGEEPDAISDADALSMFKTVLGANLDVEFLFRDSWRAGYTLVAERYREGRIFIAGDAAHLFTPTGGLGYNTAIEDAVNLGWKLAALLKGYGGEELLDTYEPERRPNAIRNTGHARRFADSVGLFVPEKAIEDDSPEGEAARAAASEHLNAHVRAEFNIPGITFGARYDGSPLIISDGTTPPPDEANAYYPTACPGGRAPHLWLDDGASLYDRFGFDFTLLRLGGSHAGEAFRTAAEQRGIPLEVVDIPDEKARDLYETELALIRPDQIVAWRGNDDAEAEDVLDTALALKGLRR